MTNLRAHSRLTRVALLAVGSLAPVLLTNTAKAATIVACIGEQTTKTTDGGVTADKLWPAQLGVLLGNTYQVDNDVMTNANTVMSGNCVTAMSKNPVPSIVVIGPFAEHDYAAGVTEGQWQTAYQAVVKQYLDLVPSPDVYVMTPPPATFVYQSAAEQTFATDVVKPAVLAVAAANPAKVHVVDLFGDAKLVPGAGDGHFTVAQYVEVATLAYNAIKGGPGPGTGGPGGTGGVASSGGTAGSATGGTSAGGSTNLGGGGTGTSSGGVAGTLATGGSAPTSSGGGGSGPIGTSGAPASTSAGSAGTSNGNGAASSADSGGCSFGAQGTASSGALWVALASVALLARRRR